MPIHKHHEVYTSWCHKHPGITNVVWIHMGFTSYSFCLPHLHIGTNQFLSTQPGSFILHEELHFVVFTFISHTFFFLLSRAQFWLVPESAVLGFQSFKTNCPPPPNFLGLFYSLSSLLVSMLTRPQISSLSICEDCKFSMAEICLGEQQ